LWPVRIWRKSARERGGGWVKIDTLFSSKKIGKNGWMGEWKMESFSSKKIGRDEKEEGGSKRRIKMWIVGEWKMYIFHPRKMGSKGGMEREGGRGGSKTKKEKIEWVGRWEIHNFSSKRKNKKKGKRGGRVGKEEEIRKKNKKKDDENNGWMRNS
jgi:hypothetical protein